MSKTHLSTPSDVISIYKQLSVGPLTCLSSDQREQLITQTGLTEKEVCLALLSEAAAYAHPPISNFRVGAIAKGLSGTLYFGANIELVGANLNQTIHAEQAAITHAWMKGETGISDLFISESPCGYCRQFMTELTTSDCLNIILPDIEPQSLQQILPHFFGPADLGITDKLMAPIDHQLDSHEFNPLEQEAGLALNHSYAPYSHAYSGMALALSNGVIIRGAYAENAAFNPSLSPLQTAIIMLIMSGYSLSMITSAALVEVKNSPLKHYEPSLTLLRAINPSITLTYQTIDN